MRRHPQKLDRITDLSIAQGVRRFFRDANFAPIQDEAELAKLPEDLRKECVTFWAEVRELLRELQ